MKVTRKETKETFKPFSLEIEFESKNEAAEFAAIFELGFIKDFFPNNVKIRKELRDSQNLETFDRLVKLVISDVDCWTKRGGF